jgi:hypothetical protein
MTDRAITTNMRRGRGPNLHVFEYNSTAALTATANKKEWIAPFAGKIVDVICDSETAGSGGVSDIIDININGTTIYTTQANRPTLLVGDTGLFTEASEPEVVEFRAGDILGIDVDQIATTGSARFKCAIVVVER